jgi:hypothetical protein
MIINFTPRTAEQALLMVFAIDYSQLMNVEGINQTRSFVEHNESGLAYDDLVCCITNEVYQPSSVAFELIKVAGSLMGIEYPKLSTD